jgi:uncharacterized membrane protein YcaP (DUF421 family)
MAAVFRAVFGYLFLVLMVRIVGRRPGRQMAPFDFVLIFFLGGLTLTGMVANDRSVTNAVVQIMTVAAVHYILIRLRRRWPKMGLALDGSPLVLINRGQWHAETLKKMQVSEDDVMAAARNKGITSLAQIDYAILERNGAISIFASEQAQ